ncbi:MAG: alanine racemase, partial [Bacteroidales bacterium]|nr:alanine racemase [Bacteroidales bacterium]
MLKYSKIKSPVFAVNKAVVRANIKNMMDKLPASCLFRPHFKTHNNKETAKLFKEFGVKCITVSSVEMAQYFRVLGFKDITIAFPVNLREHRSLNKLSKNTKIGLTFSNIDAVSIISGMPLIKADAWIEIDTGYNRSGIAWDSFEEIENCISLINKTSHLKFKGFLTHNGSTYLLKTKDDILKSSLDSIAKMKMLKERYAVFETKISIGDTPGCSLMTDFTDIDEIRPGNFVYYDLMMLNKGVCTKEQIAVTVFCSVVDVNPERNEVVIHGGAIHFSKEFVKVGENLIYGKAIRHIGKQNSEVDENLVSLSQEHGVVLVENGDISNYHVGDLVEIVP